MIRLPYKLPRNAEKAKKLNNMLCLPDRKNSHRQMTMKAIQSRDYVTYLEAKRHISNVNDTSEVTKHPNVR